jgi:transcriptional regulator with XRE-family HTH domain
MLVVVGARLRAARHDAGLTQTKVETWYGIDRAYVGQVENGQRNASLLMVVRFATVYGVDPGWLVTGLRHTPDLWPLDPVQPHPFPLPPDGNE